MTIIPYAENTSSGRFMKNQSHKIILPLDHLLMWEARIILDRIWHIKVVHLAISLNMNKYIVPSAYFKSCLYTVS